MNIDNTYDDVGNRLTRVVDSQTENYTYFTGTNRLQQITGPVAYTYDANGNITGIGDKVLVYNQNNRLIRVEENATVLGEYTYNGLGQRAIKEVDGVVTVFHYDFNGNIIAESDDTGVFAYEYLYKHNSRIALVDVSTGEMFFFMNDRLGTPQMLTDSTNTVVWEGYYKPFGEAEVNPNSSVVNNFRFPGQYFDQEIGLHYNWHRYYDSSTGRYLTPDPIGIAGGINSYAYSKNNSINITDTTGLFGPATVPLFIVGAPLLVGGAYYALAPQKQQRAIIDFIKKQFLTSPIVRATIAWMTAHHHEAPYCEARRRGRDPRILQPRPNVLGPLKGAPSLPYPGANIGSPDPNLPPSPKPPKPPKTFWEKVKFFVIEGAKRVAWIFNPPY